MVFKYKRECQYCHKVFETDKPQKRYCSAECRDAYTREGKNIRKKNKKDKKKIYIPNEYCQHDECRYWELSGSMPICNYLLKTGTRRGCSIKECQHYKE